jgi:hypothetical protein
VSLNTGDGHDSMTSSHHVCRSLDHPPPGATAALPSSLHAPSPSCPLASADGSGSDPAGAGGSTQTSSA